MPIEIRELTIKAVVNNGAPAQGGAQGGAGGGGGDKKQIVAECVEKVMEILEKKKEF